MKWSHEYSIFRIGYKRQLVALQREITDLKVFKELLLQKQSDKIVVLSIFVDLPSGRNLSGAIRSSSGTVTDRSLLYADSSRVIRDSLISESRVDTNPKTNRPMNPIQG